MNEEFVEKYRKILNETHLIGCENILCGDVAYYTLWLMNSEDLSFIRFVREIVSILLMTFYNRYEFRIIGHCPKTLCLFSSSYCGREDLKHNFLKAANLIPNRIDMFCGLRRKYFQGLNLVKHLYKLLIWNKCLKKQIPNLFLRVLVIRVIYNALIDYSLFKNFEKKYNLNISGFLTICDVHAVDSFFSQKFNLNNLLTVTLQHGTVSSSHNQWNLSGISSKYFICYNKFTIDEARKLAFNKKIILAGVLSCIGKPLFICPSIFNKKNIGIILDGEKLREDNLVIIDFVLNYFNKLDFNIFFKFHPSSNIDTYKDYLPFNSKYFGKEISIMEFADKIDIAIVSFSTVMIELLQIWKPVFVIHTSKQKYDLFKNSKCFRFSNEVELTQLLNSVGSEDFINQLIQTRDYYCTNGDITDNYIKAFKRIGII